MNEILEEYERYKRRMGIDNVNILPFQRFKEISDASEIIYNQRKRLKIIQNKNHPRDNRHIDSRIKELFRSGVIK